MTAWIVPASEVLFAWQNLTAREKLDRDETVPPPPLSCSVVFLYLRIVAQTARYTNLPQCLVSVGGALHGAFECYLERSPLSFFLCFKLRSY